MTKKIALLTLAVGIVVSLTFSRSKANASPQAKPSAVSVGPDNIGGTVVSSKGPEAGVWVIAETTDFPTKFAKIVVTDDQGRYLIPELPKANYKVWVRGYGLIDSAPVRSATGMTVDLKAVLAPDAKAAAEYYPSNYWYALMQLPPESDFPGTGPSGNGISPDIKYRAQWVDSAKVNTCESCHQIGDKATREIPESFGHFDSSLDAWTRRISSGQAGMEMNFSWLPRWKGRDRVLSMYADWTDRIKAGEYPAQAPPRPQGMERNVVISEWDWGTPKEYFHDLVATDRRHPTVNANGLLYGVHEEADDMMSFLDPVKNVAGNIPIPVEDGVQQVKQEMTFPSPNWGTEPIWSSHVNAHSFAMDNKGRVWFVAATKPSDNPAFCKQGSSNPSAALHPLDRGGRSIMVYDPETKKFTPIVTCFSTHHIELSEDGTDTLYFDSGGSLVGWFNTKIFDQTHDMEKAQGWTAMIVDTNGNGKRDAFTEPGKPMDPTKDTQVNAPLYEALPSPIDNSVWGTSSEFPGAVVHMIPGSNPPATALTEIFQTPFKNPKAPVQGYGPRGGDIDKDGVVWMGLTSGHFASFDRRKCKGPLNGPDALGQQCPEGWTLFPLPGPKFKGTDIASDSGYYAFVDKYDTLGLGNNVPIAFGDGSDSFMALTPGTGKFVTLRVPYPLGFYAKNADGRIDNPRTGWKGRGLWSSYDTRAPAHIEGGKGTESKVVKFQIRPDPLAK